MEGDAEAPAEKATEPVSEAGVTFPPHPPTITEDILHVSVHQKGNTRA